MSVCLEAGAVLANPVGTSSSSQVTEEITTSQSALRANAIITCNDKADSQDATAKSIAKLVVSNHPSITNSVNPVLQKVVNPPLITVLNPSGPLTVVKTLCVTSGVSSAPQFTLVNSAPLNVTNAVGKTPTITLLNAPVTVVKTISTQSSEKNADAATTNSAIINNVSPAILENRGHNVFVKNTCNNNEATVPDLSQSHKLLTASNFPQTNVLANVPQCAKTANGQRNKLKILSNVVMPGPSQPPANLLLNKTNSAQRYLPRQKLISTNGAPNKYINKPITNNVTRSNINPMKHVSEKSPQRMVYPTHKSQIKTIPAMNNYVQKPSGIKTLSPQHKNTLGHMQRTGSGLRTIPPQRPSKMPNKPNYIGKHAVQAQKLRQTHGKLKGMKMPPNSAYNLHSPVIPDKQLTFNQALTAEILETLSNKSTPPSNSYSSKHYEILPTRYDNAYSCPDIKPSHNELMKHSEEKNKSGLDALSLICQAVLLDHNYNATLPPDSPTRSLTTQNQPVPVNGISGNLMYSPGSGKRRTLSTCNPITSSNLSNIPIPPSNTNSLIHMHEDDAASDVSDVSDRKHDTEGEETDTAPEAEAVTHEDQFDHYGDYVTRCICGFVHDDGYMIECDRCKVWQHVQCVVKNRQVPDEYLCETCDPSKPIDRQKARIVQQQWLKERQFADPKLRKDNKIKEVFKHKETLSDTDSSDAEQPVHNNNVVPKASRTLANRRKTETHPKQTAPSRQRRDSAKEVVQRRQKRKEKKVIKRRAKSQTKAHSDDENQDMWSSHLPQLRQWIEKYEEAVTNHYSPELRARISSIRVNGAHSDLPVQFDSSVHKCRVYTQPLTELKYIVSTVHLPPNTPVIELRGKYMLSTQHRNSGGSLTTRQHSQRPGPFLFFYRLHKDNTEVCVDTRTYGNSARFIRRSCKPNAELRHCIEKGVLHLYIVSITTVEKNSELTIKHESHDLAAIGTTQIACACGNIQECTVNKSPLIKKNGESSDILRKRRGRRTISVGQSVPSEPETPITPKEEIPSPLCSPQPPEPIENIKVEIKEEHVDIKEEFAPVEEPKEEIKVKEEIAKVVKEEPLEEVSDVDSKIKVKEEAQSPPPTPITTRRSSHHKSDKEDSKESTESKEEKSKCKKLSREERKLEAILRAIEQMEKADQRKQEHQAKQAHRRESEPGPTPKEEEKLEPKLKRKKRKGRARTTSTNQSARRNRLNSTDSYMTSGDETMLSPSDSQPPNVDSSKDMGVAIEQNEKAIGLLLALSNGDNINNKSDKTPPRETESNSNSAHSSPETQLSSACLLVQAAVEPLESGFKFPKTKKGLMNEWLNKAPEPIQAASSISPVSFTSHINTSNEYDSNSGFYSPAKNLAALAQVATFCDTNVQAQGSAKKRWLRQAISEDHCDSPSGRPESPNLSDAVAPPKKRRLPRETLTNVTSPPLTPTNSCPPNTTKSENDKPSQEGCVEIVYSGTDGDSPTQSLESDAVLKERAAKMKQEFSKCVVPPMQELPHTEAPPTRCLVDPRLAQDTHLYSHGEHLVGAVEKTLCILGFEERRPEAITPAKRKLSITEYRQRKKLNVNEKSDDPEPEPTSTEENNSLESFKPSRPRAGSTSSTTSISSTDDELATPELTGKVPAFNSEPTELELQREISSLRLKKAFGLAVDGEARKPALDVETILSCELPSMVKPTIPLSSPTFPMPGTCEIQQELGPQSPKTSFANSSVGSVTSPSERGTPSPHPPPPPTPPPPTPPPPTPPPPAQSAEPEREQPVEASVISPREGEEKTADKNIKPNMFYTPDEEEEQHTEEETSFDEEEVVNYVPPFNNPVYPNESFAAFSSTIDDDARYEGRNPSPPPDVEIPSNFPSSKL